MQEYLNMWRNYINFSDRTNKRGFWMATLINLIIVLVLGVIVMVLPFLVFLTWLYSLAIFIPGIGIGVRRLRDAGKQWYNIFWPFLPVIGTIILIIILCKPSIADDGVRVV